MAEEGATAKWSDLRRRVKEQQEEERKRKEMEKSEEERMLEKDDRWSAFMKIVKTKAPPVKLTLDDCLARVLLAKSQRKQQENVCKTATSVLRQITEIAYNMNPDWKAYVTQKRTAVHTAPLRTLAKDMYECMVPLVRPMRLDGFKVVQRPLDEMAQHRCLIQLNDALSRQELTLVREQWRPHINTEGCLSPKAILKWFNKGLADAVPVLLSDNHNVDKLACSVGDDGTATLHATVSDFVNEQLHISVFSINVYPVMTLDQLPTSLKVSAPIPAFGGYIQGQKDFRRLVREDMENGKEIAFLDPKQEENPSPIKSCMKKDGLSWKINLSFTEYHVYNSMDRYCRGLDFRHVLVLMNILRDENPDLGILNNDLLVNTLFTVSQKNMDKLRTKDSWLYTTMQVLCESLKNNFLPCFYLPRQNLLDTYHISLKKRIRAQEKLEYILESVKTRPKDVYKFTGFASLDTSRVGSAVKQDELQEVSKEMPKEPVSKHDKNVEKEKEQENVEPEKEKKANKRRKSSSPKKRSSSRNATRTPEPNNEIVEEDHIFVDEKEDDVICELPVLRTHSRTSRRSNRHVTYMDENSEISKITRGERSDIY